MEGPSGEALKGFTLEGELYRRPAHGRRADAVLYRRRAGESDVGEGFYGWPDIHGIRFGPFAGRSVNSVGTEVKGSLEMNPALDWDGHNYGMDFAHGTCSPVPGFTRVSSAGGSGTKVIPWKNRGALNDVDIAFGAGRGLVVYTCNISGSTNPNKATP